MVPVPRPLPSPGHRRLPRRRIGGLAPQPGDALAAPGAAGGAAGAGGPGKSHGFGGIGANLWLAESTCETHFPMGRLNFRGNEVRLVCLLFGCQRPMTQLQANEQIPERERVGLDHGPRHSLAVTACGEMGLWERSADVLLAVFQQTIQADLRLSC